MPDKTPLPVTGYEAISLRLIAGNSRRHRFSVLDLAETQITGYVVASPTGYGVFDSQTGVAR